MFFFTRKIEKAFAKSGLNSHAAADQIGVSHDKFLEWIRGESKPGLLQRGKIIRDLRNIRR